MSPHSSPTTRGLPDVPRDPLPIDVVDNHVHLDITREGDEPFDVAEAIARARAVGVTRLVQVGCDLDGIAFTMELIERHPEVVGGIALHPNEVPKLAAAGTLSAAYELVERNAAHERIRAIGETGLDYYRTGPDGVAAQQDGFRWHIELAKRLGKALQIHDRDAHDDVLRILDEQGAPERTVLHCFSGDLAFARECVARGYYLSFAGTVTFKNARDLRNALTATPLDQLLVETDAPYLTPMPHRGATNASYLVPHTIRAMAGVLNVDVPSLCRAVSDNSERVFAAHFEFDRRNHRQLHAGERRYGNLERRRQSRDRPGWDQQPERWCFRHSDRCGHRRSDRQRRHGQYHQRGDLEEERGDGSDHDLQCKRRLHEFRNCSGDGGQLAV